ncbi:MAG: DUF4956 domain-containing protein [Pirellulales bacterium]
MLDWLRDEVVVEDSGLGWQGLAMRLSLAMLSGLFVAAVYSLSQRRRLELTGPLPTTLVLLTILVAMTTLVIGNSVARAFGLVGALSIVRFRTVVEDTRDTAFVIFAVVVGMAIGSGYVAVTLLGVPLVSLTALGLGRISGPAAPSPDQRELVVRVGIGVDSERLFAPIFERLLTSQRLQSVLSARQGAALDLHYAVQLRPGESPLTLVKALHPLEGVQSVELREAD